MACKDAKKNRGVEMASQVKETEAVEIAVSEEQKAERLLFGVDSRTPSDDILQNNLTEF